MPGSESPSPAPGPAALAFDGIGLAGHRRFALAPDRLVIAGWAGRDTAAMEAHIRELEAIGVARPRATPMFYRVAAALATQAPRIEVAGDGSTGEAEVVLIHAEDGFWISIGSDHTDRRLETVGVTLSKQVCAKPLGRTAWRLDDLRPHWDRIVLRCIARIDGRTQVYQEGPLAGLHTPDALLEKYQAAGHAFPPGSLMFCGTVPIHGGFRFADHVRLELVDPVLGRSLGHDYAIHALEIVD